LQITFYGEDMKYFSVTLRVILTFAFLAAGVTKIIGVEMMVKTFDHIGLGQWLRYLTGFVEVLGAILLWTPNRQALGALTLTVTMIGAVLTHIFILGPSSLPAVVLGALSICVLYLHKEQVIILLDKNKK
jgi:uncharacterized membrane protein YphA (DoxX/SURF4 family)